MDRAGYSNDIDQWQMIKWRGQVASATRGKRGQKILTDLLAALDEMPDKALAIGELQTEGGDVCALGALGRARGIDMAAIDPDELDQVALAFDIAEQLAREIVYMNDEYYDRWWDQTNRRMVNLTPGERWTKMREWVAKQIRPQGGRLADAGGKFA